MNEPLISEEQIGKILYVNMDNGFGCPSKQYENARYAIHQAIHETAEACAKVCGELMPEDKYAQWHYSGDSSYGSSVPSPDDCATEIHSRMGEG